MKKLLVLALILCLFGCSNTNNIEKELDEVFSNRNYVMTKANNYTDYINFYLPSDIKEIDCEKLSYIFDVDGCKLIMNINLPYIFNEYYYNDNTLQDEGPFDESKLVFSCEGDTLDSQFNKVFYSFKAYQFDDVCILQLISNEVSMYGYCHKGKIKLLAEKMLQMVKNSWVDSAKVINDYAEKDVIDYQRKAVNLFERIIPRDGSVEDALLS